MTFRFRGQRRPGSARVRPRHKRGEMNKTERAYADLLDQSPSVVFWAFETTTFLLAPDLRFTPDFKVQLDNGSIEYHEVKASTKKGVRLIEDDAYAKIKMAAAQHPETFIIATKNPTAVGGWEYQTMKGTT